MTQNTASTKNFVLTVMNKTVLIENDAKRSLYQKGRFSSRFRVTVITKYVLSQMMQNTASTENVRFIK